MVDTDAGEGQQRSHQPFQDLKGAEVYLIYKGGTYRLRATPWAHK